MSNFEDVTELLALQDISRIDLQVGPDRDLGTSLSELGLLGLLDLHVGEKGVNQSHENVNISLDNLGDVEISQGLHEDEILSDVEVGTL